MTTPCPPLLASAIEPVAASLMLRSADRFGEIIPPRTKKNHSRIVRLPGVNRPLLKPSAEYEAWERGVWRWAKEAGLVQRSVSVDSDGIPEERWSWPETITRPVNCRALVFRHANIGDAVGYYQAIADCLEVLGVVENDRLIVSWDGTRLLKDAKDPRVEIVLEEVR